MDCPLRSKSRTKEDPFPIRFVATICLGTLGHYRRCDQEQVLQTVHDKNKSSTYIGAHVGIITVLFLCFPWKFFWMPQDRCHVVPQLISQSFFVPLFSITFVSHDLGTPLDNAPETLNNRSFLCAYVWSTQIIFPLYVMRNYSVLFVPEILVIPHGYGIHKFALKKENVWWKKNLRHHTSVLRSDSEHSHDLPDFCARDKQTRQT